MNVRNVKWGVVIPLGIFFFPVVSFYFLLQIIKDSSDETNYGRRKTNEDIITEVFGKSIIWLLLSILWGVFFIGVPLGIYCDWKSKNPTHHVKEHKNYQQRNIIR